MNDTRKAASPVSDTGVVGDGQETLLQPQPVRREPVALHPNGPFPQPFGRYVVQQLLGRGGMGSVFLADDTVLEVPVALKVPHAALLADPETLQRFRGEARAAARLCHPGLCQVFDVNQHEGVHYLALRYIEGAPLSKDPPREPRAVATLVRKLADAMAEAHRLGVIHRDLKPSNILVTPRGEPVVTDFGLALRVDPRALRLTRAGAVMGTPLYMAPEQFAGDPGAIGPACDVFSLGMIFYELLTGRTPRSDALPGHLFRPDWRDVIVDPCTHRPELDPALGAICLRALAWERARRLPSMTAFAEALASYLGETVPTAARPPAADLKVPLIRREAIRFAFVATGERAPAARGPEDRLYLDVGNDLRPGVIDHHHLTAYAGSTAGMVLAHPQLVRGAVNPSRQPGDPFTIVLHEQPDFDGVAASYLAVALLTTGTLPEGAEALAAYADQVDEGLLGMSPTQPYSLYAAFQIAGQKLLRTEKHTDSERWQESLRLGLEITKYALGQMLAGNVPLPEVDAFGGPGRFTRQDRREIERDIARYEQKLNDPRTRARTARLRLPGRFGGKVDVPALLVRDVQNADDPGRCLFFKDWARSDAHRAGQRPGFVALSVFMSEGRRQPRRCLLSVAPGSGATLRGLGALLDLAEAERRRQIFGTDDRVTDPATGAAKPARPGYANADPWYDGRAHGYTVVDAPHAGTTLSADEIETLLLRWGQDQP